VLEGAIRSQINDGPVTAYKAGQSFSELPGDRHGVSANASKTKPGQAPRGVRGGRERDGTDDSIRERYLSCGDCEDIAEVIQQFGAAMAP
jgi:hypothetical protein